MCLYYHEFTDDELAKLTNLKSLELNDGDNIMGATIRLLTNLESLSVYRNDNLTNEDISKLTNLRRLHLENCQRIDPASIKKILPKSVQYIVW